MNTQTLSTFFDAGSSASTPCEGCKSNFPCHDGRNKDNALFCIVGDDLRSVTIADVSQYRRDLAISSQFRSEVLDMSSFSNMSRIIDAARAAPDKFREQLGNLSCLVSLFTDPDMADSLKFDARYLADLVIQCVIAIKLLSTEASAVNLTLVFTSVISKLNFPTEKLAYITEFLTIAIGTLFDSVKSIGFKSESAGAVVVDTFHRICDPAMEVLDDKVLDIVFMFFAKVVAFWTTVSGGFDETQFKISSLPLVVSKLREVKTSGADIIECLLSTYLWMIDNFPKFLVGDFSGLYFGKAETGVYETRVSKITKAYPIVLSGSSTILKEEYGHTLNSFDTEVSQLVSLGDKMLARAISVQKPALKRMVDDLRVIQADRRLKQSQIQTKISAIGICFVGAPGTGKSLIMDQTSRTLIAAAGEVPSSDKIVTGQMSDKFDSNELPSHLSIQYDDVANNSKNENFDKLLNAINSQARPFLKAGVEEKGIMYPGNVACVVSTNIPGMGAQKSNCPDSMGRRFLHIHTEIKPSLIAEVCVPGTKRIDPTKASKFGQARMDIWKFSVYEFISFEADPEEEMPMDIIFWENMYVRPIAFTTKPLEEQTFWDLAAFLTERAKRHFVSQRGLLENMLSKQNEEYCMECCTPVSVCSCHVKSEFVSDYVNAGLDELVRNYEIFDAITRRWWSIATWRTAISLSWALCPANHQLNFKLAASTSLPIAIVSRSTLIGSIYIMVVWTVLCFVILFALAWKKVYDKVRTTSGLLSYASQYTMSVLRDQRKNIFAGTLMVSMAYCLYRAFRPRSEQMSYREALPENVRSAFARHEAARTTDVTNLIPLIQRDLGMITVTTSIGSVRCLAFPVMANCYLTVGHVVPKVGEFEILISHESGLCPTAAKQKLTAAHVYRIPNKDLVLIRVPSAMPRRGYLDYFLTRPVELGSQVVKIISLDVTNQRRTVSDTRMSPGWSMFSSTVNTDKVTLVKPYKYPAPLGTMDGMCGSLVVDYDKSIIYGFHVAGNGKVGLCDTVTSQELQLGLDSFNGFIPANQGDLQMGQAVLSQERGLITLETGDASIDKPIKDHNCLVEGVLPGAGATFTNPYMRHPFSEDIVKEFGEPKFGPPQKINSAIHKRKALSNLTSPNQEFSLSEIDVAVADYREPILEAIRRMPLKECQDLARPLSLDEALDGLPNSGLGGIDNSTSVGYPFRGKKKDFLARDPVDPILPLTPRELVERGGVSMVEEMDEMLRRYKSGISCRPLFKCSMKTNELLSVDKVKARVFMGCNFPFLLLGRRYLAPVIRHMLKERFMYETSKGINMDSIEAEELYNFLKVEGGKRIVALDYSAFDQTMSAQVSTAAAGVFIDIMRTMGCSDEHIMIARGLLTDITYPNLHFFGTILQLANSDPSGNLMTTELNGVVNSLYLRIFFYRIYPSLVMKVKYRKAVRTSTYGDDNINGVLEKYSQFNGVNIVREGAKCGLKITMADKKSDVTEFTDIHESDFLKRKFRFCPDLGHIRAPLSKESIEKGIHWMKRDSPVGHVVLFSQTVDGMLRKSSQYGETYFNEVSDKLKRIAAANGVSQVCEWWTYARLIKNDKALYYDRSGSEMQYDPFESDYNFRSEAYVVPPVTNHTAPRLFVMLAEWVLALFPFINAGRFAEIFLSPMAFSWVLFLMTLVPSLFNLDRMPVAERVSISRIVMAAKQMFVKVWLRTANDVIRAQPYCFLLEGEPGAGKTTCALAIVKHLIPNIHRSEIIVLNEDDEFQSELRSNHRVIIIDDVANTKSEWLTSSPMRRVIDAVNNTPRRALSPDVELKGNIVLAPEMVICTTNLTAVELASRYSACPSSLYRRWRRVRVRKTSHFRFAFDLSAWTVAINKHRATLDSNSYNNSAYVEAEWEEDTFVNQLARFKVDYDLHHDEQRKLVAMVNAYFDGEETPKGRTWSQRVSALKETVSRRTDRTYTLVKETTVQLKSRTYNSLARMWRQAFGYPFKSEGVDWDTEMVHILLHRDLTPENIKQEILLAKETLLKEQHVSYYDNVPNSMTFTQTWWEWLCSWFIDPCYKSEGLADLTVKQRESLKVARPYLQVIHHGVVVGDGYVLHGVDLYYTTTKGMSEAVKDGLLVTPNGLPNRTYTCLPNFVSVSEVVSYFDALEQFEVVPDLSRRYPYGSTATEGRDGFITELFEITCERMGIRPYLAVAKDGETTISIAGATLALEVGWEVVAQSIRLFKENYLLAEFDLVVYNIHTASFAVVLCSQPSPGRARNQVTSLQLSFVAHLGARCKAFYYTPVRGLEELGAESSLL